MNPDTSNEEEKRKCEWCLSEVPANSKVCSYCGRFRMDIYKGRILSWTFWFIFSCAFFIDLVVYLIGFIIEPTEDVWGYFISYIFSVEGLLLTIATLISLALFIYFFSKTSKKFGTWIWF